jgi:hypothetical protein
MNHLCCDPSTTFRGSVTDNARKVLRVDVDSFRSLLSPKPSELFEWGIDSPGADHLSFALLREVLGEDDARSGSRRQADVGPAAPRLLGPGSQRRDGGPGKAPARPVTAPPACRAWIARGGPWRPQAPP